MIQRILTGLFTAVALGGLGGGIYLGKQVHFTPGYGRDVEANRMVVGVWRDSAFTEPLFIPYEDLTDAHKAKVDDWRLGLDEVVVPVTRARTR